jgi:hypothetical protein
VVLTKHGAPQCPTRKEEMYRTKEAHLNRPKYHPPNRTTRSSNEEEIRARSHGTTATEDKSTERTARTRIRVEATHTAEDPLSNLSTADIDSESDEDEIDD